MSARIRVPADVAGTGSVLVPGRLLVEIIRSLPGLPVEFADDPDGVSMTCGEAAFTLATLPLGRVPGAAGTAAARRDGGRRRARRRDRPGHAGREPGRHAADADRGQRRARRRDDDARRDRPLPARRPGARLESRAWCRRPREGGGPRAGADAGRRGTDDEPGGTGADHARATVAARTAGTP